MKLTGNTVLITGGSEGIGLELARALAPENTVIICGRSAEKLERAKSGLPGVYPEVCDVTDPSQRRALVERVLKLHPQLNLLVNNAGAKRRTVLPTGEGVDAAMRGDMALNFTAPVSLVTALLPRFRSLPCAAIVNLTTGLVHLPKAEQAFYCTAKAALHSYTQSLRWALRGSTVAVHEVLLTLVATDFHRGELPNNIPAITAQEAAGHILRGIRRNRAEIYVGKAALARWLSVLAPNRGMAIVNR